MSPSDLGRFRECLQSLITDDTMRPFVCSGSPLDCRIFIVGFNPATTLGTGFWSYWTDEQGFDKFRFKEDYLRARKMRGARPRIEAIVEQVPANWCLETNICSKPTRRAADLTRADRRTAIFRYLFEVVKPEVLFLHSNMPIEFFRKETGCPIVGDGPEEADWRGHRFTVFARPGPIWRMGLDDARALGQQLGRQIWNGPERQSQIRLPLSRLAEQFNRRFSEWSIKLPRLDLQQRRAGTIVFEGWFIRYQFGRNQRGEYLEYSAEHRMMFGGEHMRLYENGDTEPLLQVQERHESLVRK